MWGLHAPAFKGTGNGYWHIRGALYWEDAMRTLYLAMAYLKANWACLQISKPARLIFTRSSYGGGRKVTRQVGVGRIDRDAVEGWSELQTFFLEEYDMETDTWRLRIPTRN